ncbi:hypothetical protein [Asaia platycodi]|uniref:hypothetical protein n=1 Tax=Asaia platycodi TaxID=610243 RepID=UPI0011DD0480|nr:hypothetical protein [Asaia platycodi]
MTDTPPGTVSSWRVAAAAGERRCCETVMDSVEGLRAGFLPAGLAGAVAARVDAAWRVLLLSFAASSAANALHGGAGSCR